MGASLMAPKPDDAQLLVASESGSEALESQIGPRSKKFAVATALFILAACIGVVTLSQHPSSHVQKSPEQTRNLVKFPSPGGNSGDGSNMKGKMSDKLDEGHCVIDSACAQQTGLVTADLAAMCNEKDNKIIVSDGPCKSPYTCSTTEEEFNQLAGFNGVEGKAADKAYKRN